VVRTSEGEENVEAYYKPDIVIGIVSRWRRPTNRAICELCKNFKTKQCPFTSTPPIGHCELFLINASSFEEAADLLFKQDAPKSGVVVVEN
jgi:hypothetical protein